MCNKRNSMRHILRAKTVRLDECISMLVFTLNQREFKTLGSCCGHGKYHMTIVYEELGEHWDFISGVKIPRKRRFYKKDKQGYYYIPEVERTYVK